MTTARFPKAWRMTKRGRPKMSAQWLKSCERRARISRRWRTPSRGAGAERRGKDGSSSSSSSSEESSDTEPDTDPAGPDANVAAMKLNRLSSAGVAGGVVGDETLLEMAREEGEGRERPVAQEEAREVRGNRARLEPLSIYYSTLKTQRTTR